MGNNLNLVETKLAVAGSPCHFTHLTLTQGFNSHHTFEIKLDFQELDEKWMNSPVQIIQLIGEEVEITMQHRQTGESNPFKGIITNVSMAGRHGEQNCYILYGCSPTIKLEDRPTMDCFVDSNLKNIVTEAVATSGNGGEVTVNPKFASTIDYISQYNESAFAFLNRLSHKYGEWNFYDGVTHYFGKPDLGTPAEIYYDKEMTHFDLRAGAVRPNGTRFHYISSDNDPISNPIPETVDGVRGYIKAALDASKKIYSTDAILPLEPVISNRKELEDMVKAEKYREVAQSLIMQGQTQTCKVRIGKLVKVALPKTMDVPVKEVETFLVTEVTHHIDQDGTYYNTFKGIPSEMENVPMPSMPLPNAYPQVAWVKSNADPKNQGRVQVETQWQKLRNKTTNWIKVQTPDAGGSDKVSSNRGLVTIPEEGDLVMLNFEYGDPDRPYCAGSVFTSQSGGGGGQGNKSKSLTSRSGNALKLNDEDGSVTLNDKAGSDSFINMDGSENIFIVSKNSIVLNCGESTIYMDKDGKIAIEGVEVNISGKSQVNIASGAEGGPASGMQIVPSKISMGAEAEINLGGEAAVISIGSESGAINIVSGGADIIVGGKTVRIN
jgi:Uncharacterized protein conserved in bacteria